MSDTSHLADPERSGPLRWRSAAAATSALSVAGKMWIIVTMFVGRLGPLTLATWVKSGRRPRVKYPEGRVMIG